MECKLELNKEKCPCKSLECERRGICCDCLKAHVSRKSLPICLRNLDWIKTVE